MHRFVGIALGRERAPTILRLRHLLEPHYLGKKLFEQVHWHLEAQGMKGARGTFMIKNTFRFCEGVLQGAHKECEPLVRHLRPGEFVHGAALLVAGSRGKVSPMNAKWPERASTTKVKHPKLTQNLDADDHACVRS